MFIRHTTSTDKPLVQGDGYDYNTFFGAQKGNTIYLSSYEKDQVILSL